MNHDKEIREFAEAYMDVLMKLQGDIYYIADPKHKIEKQQELDKFIHYMLKVSEIVRDLNQWLTVFGLGAEKQ